MKKGREHRNTNTRGLNETSWRIHVPNPSWRHISWQLSVVPLFDNTSTIPLICNTPPFTIALHWWYENIIFSSWPITAVPAADNDDDELRMGFREWFYLELLSSQSVFDHDLTRVGAQSSAPNWNCTLHWDGPAWTQPHRKEAQMYFCTRINV